MSGQKRAVVLGGRTGLVGRPVAEALAKAGYEVRATTRAELDPLDERAATDLLEGFRPDVVVNAIAYTAVDKAEDEPEEAYRLNRDLPALWARLCAGRETRLVHFSTDFVFDGTSARPYLEDDPVGPRSVYGSSKLAGEKALLEVAPPGLLILRTAWLFGPYKTNFVDKIISLARTREMLRVVHDQVGSPTSTLDLAGFAVDLLRLGASGLFHAVNAGRASWCDLAAEAVTMAGLPCHVVPIASSEYPQKAIRPRYSVLDTSKLASAIGRAPRPWIASFREYIYFLTGGNPDE